MTIDATRPATLSPTLISGADRPPLHREMYEHFNSRARFGSDLLAERRA